jgi:hypothetical protein
MNAVNAFYEINSYGLTSFQTTITPVLPLPQGSAFYQLNYLSLLADARAAALTAGFDTANFDLDCVFCGFAFSFNRAWIGQKGAWLSGLDTATACHEFGHNFGLNHANAWLATDFTTIGAGYNVEYGNWFDTMGYGPNGFNALEKHLLGWLPDSAVTTVSSNGVYRIFGIDSSTLDSTSAYAIKIHKDDTRDYWIETRRPDADSQLSTGVLLTWSPWAESNGGTELLDCHPGTYRKPALQVGQSFYDLDAGVKITPLQVAEPVPGFADVQVEFIQTATADLALPQPDINGGTNASNPAAGASTLSGQTGTGGLTTLTVPADGDYTLWVLAEGAPSASEPLALTIVDDAGTSGIASSTAVDGQFAWTPVGPANSGGNGNVQPLTFSWTKGGHAIRVFIQTGKVNAFHLLATTDTNINLPPALSPIGDQWIVAGNSVAIPFFITATGEEAASVRVHVSSDDPTFPGSANLRFTQAGANCLLTIKTSETQLGSVGIHVTATDPLGRLAGETFTLTVLGPIQALVKSASPGGHVQLPAGSSVENVVIDKDLILEGAGPGQTIITGLGNGPTLTVNAGCTVQLSGITIRNGGAGGVHNFGTLRILSSSIEENSGAGIQNHGTLDLEQVTIINNTRAYLGGGLDNSGSATLKNCSIMSNSVTSGGGGIINRKGATCLCDSCCIALNQAVPGNGGGVLNQGVLTLRNCTVAGNRAMADVNNKETASIHRNGGGIANTGQLTLLNTTICRNLAKSDGGGLQNTGQADLANTLIAVNSSATSSAVDCSGTLNSKGHNLIQNAAGFTLAGDTTSDIIGVDSRLDILRDNGGFTQTAALMPGSPAINAADSALSPDTDQRGVVRPIGAASDIGAFEYQAAPVLRLQSGTSAGQFQLQPNQHYILEVSTDLTHWTVVGDYDTGAAGILSFDDPSQGSLLRFYRVRLPIPAVVAR